MKVDKLSTFFLWRRIKLNEKKKVGNTQYTIEQDINISGTHYIFAVDEKNEMPYLVCEITSNDLFERYENCVVSDEYLTAFGEWNNRMKKAIDDCKKKLSEVPEYMTLSTDDVEPLTHDMSIKNKVIVIKPDVFLREARYSQKQLHFCVGGFGAEPNSRGRAVMCDSINDDKHTRFNRMDVLGIIKEDRIPNWAKPKIAELQTTHTEPITASANTASTSATLKAIRK